VCVYVSQRTFEFRKKNNVKVKEDVTADVKQNYVRYHLKDGNSEITVIQDFNKVSVSNQHSTMLSNN